jgi:hypothetical protein
VDLREYERRIVETTHEDWTIITCRGAGAGPSYLEHMSVWTTGKGEFANLDVESHGMRASLKSDLSIWIAWGYPCNPDFKEEWANQFPDPKASSAYVDFFYGAGLVYRDLYVSVDGGRCRLPLPDMDIDRETHAVRRYTVPRNKYEFFRALDRFEHLSDFQRYFQAAGFDVIDTPWMI